MFSEEKNGGIHDKILRLDINWRFSTGVIPVIIYIKCNNDELKQYRNKPKTVKVAPFGMISRFLVITAHPIIIIPSLIGSALIVSTDDHTPTDILLVVVTDITMS